MDPSKRMARVNAQNLPGATLASYAALEARVAAANPRWRIDLVPPVGAALPKPSSGARSPEELAAAVAVVAWGSKKLNLPVRVTGSASADVVDQLAANGVSARAVRGGGPLEFSWDVAP